MPNCHREGTSGRGTKVCTCFIPVYLKHMHARMHTHTPDIPEIISQSPGASQAPNRFSNLHARGLQIFN